MSSSPCSVRCARILSKNRSEAPPQTDEACRGVDGEFVLGSIPAGTYSLSVCPESLATVTEDVTVGEADASVVFEMGRR